jgi:ABC-type nitrate/sulfonate/bicarbonate transport system substrate-binding protein
MFVLALVAALSAIVAGCGGQSGGMRSDATLLLDAAPNAIHAGVFMALERDYDGAEGVRMRVRAGGRDVIRALERGRAEAAIVDLGELARAQERGAEVVAVMAIVQRPVRPRRGAPPHPQLVLAVTRPTLQDEPTLVRHLITALRRGYEEALRDPESAVETLVRRHRDLDRQTTLQRLRRASPAFTQGATFYGELDRARLEAWARWATRTRRVRSAPKLDELVDAEIGVPAAP